MRRSQTRIKWLTRFVPSYSEQRSSREVTLGPREKGKLRPDFWTSVDTAAEPNVLRYSIETWRKGDEDSGGKSLCMADPGRP